MNIPENTQMSDDFWREVERAKKMTPQERVAEGCALSDRAFRIMADGIRHQFPEATQEERDAILRDRLATLREVESRLWIPETSVSE